MDYLDALDNMTRQLAEAARLLKPAEYALLLLMIRMECEEQLGKLS